MRPQVWAVGDTRFPKDGTASPGVARQYSGTLLTLDMLDELAAVGLRPAVLVADTGYGANADFRHGLEDRGLAYALQVKGEMTARTESAVPHQPPFGGLGPRPLPRYRARPVSLREHVLAAGRNSAVAVTWRKGSKAALSARFVFLRVRLAGRRPKPAPDLPKHADYPRTRAKLKRTVKLDILTEDDVGRR